MPGYDLCGVNRPCRTVGGDYYDFVLRDGDLLLALGDVSGKGTGAALLMTVLRASVRAHWAEPARWRRRWRASTARSARTCPPTSTSPSSWAAWSRETGRLTLRERRPQPAAAGARGRASLETLDEGGMVLGLVRLGALRARARPSSARGDTLVVFSDGVTETFERGDEEFGEERLVDVIRSARRGAPPPCRPRSCASSRRFAGGAKATDDRTLIVLKRES